MAYHVFLRKNLKKRQKNDTIMERYFNTLKSELVYHHSYSCEDKLFSDIDDYVLLWYNSVRPHSFNNGLTPWQKRLA
ncbi:MAG TPA: hypothetical protein DEQ68_01575 [Ruminococcaceae bacterium]|nr:hypothetical protein [Oscillospiraceae bacterium]